MMASRFNKTVIRFARSYTSTVVRNAAPVEGGAAATMTLNFCTPYTPIFENKVVDKVMIPGESGEYGITVGHSPLISQLKPGVVTVVHAGGETEKYFIPGGFAITTSASVTSISSPEAVAVDDIDTVAIKSAYDAAVSAASKAADGSVDKAVAQIEADTYTSMARATGTTL